MLYFETIDTPTLELLTQLQSIDILGNLRLAGDTALALQLGHRKSIDIDLFGKIDSDILEINTALNKIGRVTLLNNSQSIHIYLINGIKVDIVNYQYSWLQDAMLQDRIRLATINDIAAMKLSAITGRGTKKDFVDLYFLLNHLGLKEMLDLYLQKYHDGSTFLVLKSLVYFDDAEKEELPRMLIPVTWQNIKKKIKKEVTRLAMQ